MSEASVKKRMDPAVKAEWVKNLREHPERQGKGYLEMDGKRCCLGELCAIAVSHGVIAAPTPINGVMYYGNWNAFLPPAVREWAGLPSNDPVLLNDSSLMSISLISLDELTCSTANDDNDGLTWPQIADLIDWAL